MDLLAQKKLSPDIIAGFKRSWAKKSGVFVKNSQIIKAYQKLLKTNQIKTSPFLEQALRLKKVRSLSGIVPVAVMTKPYPCPGKCVYCPTQPHMPKSYLNDEPAVMRAQMAHFDPYLQFTRRLKQLEATGHSVEKIELIVMGGTFSVLPKKYQLNFMAQCLQAANQQKSKLVKTLKQLEQLQRDNETTSRRIVGLTLETRPDQITPKEIKWMRQLGATRVEIGVQSIYDPVLKKVKRGHGVKATIKATKLLKEAGFKVCYHLMPNLPGSDLQKDLQMFQTIFSDSHFMPDMIKIYPCVVTYQAKLHQWFKQGKYHPYTDQQLIDLLLQIKKIVPQWVRINRLGRDIPAKNISAGNKVSNIRQVLQRKMAQTNSKCQCIRCREIRSRKIENCKLEIVNYAASGGNEYFLQYKDKQNQLYALLRLRLGKIAIIRELHTYGESVPIKKKVPVGFQPNGIPTRLASAGTVQHEGLGKKLVKKAEAIARKQGFKKITVISGVGVRGYYRKLGYQLKNTYMVKSF